MVPLGESAAPVSYETSEQLEGSSELDHQKVFRAISEILDGTGQQAESIIFKTDGNGSSRFQINFKQR